MNTFAEVLKKSTHMLIPSKIGTIESINELNGEIEV